MNSHEICWLWDPFKAAGNVRKHRVSFELATMALNDLNQISQLDIESYEHRFKTLARIEDAILLIVHTEPEPERYSGRLLGRIISARKATPTERRAYYND
ncbi:BrnT family toxin [uncultured Sphingomonas sp.]|uniref:BrnT family toxin n=1 Tax=uncultured Sphingomonas sp. TaxID=158754 RepID=UPI00345BCE3D